MSRVPTRHVKEAGPGADPKAARPGRSVAAGPVGNVYPKYSTRNPVFRRLVERFLLNVGELYEHAGARTVLEVGCGEGHLAERLVRCYEHPESFVACDLFLPPAVRAAHPLISFQRASAYSLPYADESFDLVLCCEVLEHLEDPDAAFGELARVTRSAILVSVPWEPIWRILNLARGRYLTRLGNTPGHVGHFTRRAFRELVARHARIVAERRPLPWTILLAERTG